MKRKWRKSELLIFVTPLLTFLLAFGLTYGKPLIRSFMAAATGKWQATFRNAGYVTCGDGTKFYMDPFEQQGADGACQAHGGYRQFVRDHNDFQASDCRIICGTAECSDGYKLQIGPYDDELLVSGACAGHGGLVRFHD